VTPNIDPVRQLADRDVGTTPARAEWYTAPVRLRDDVSLVIGANDQPMLYCAATRSYVRLSNSAAAVVRELDGRAVHEVISGVARDVPSAAAAVDRLLAELRAAGVLTVPPEPATGRARLLRAMLPRHPRRIRLTGPMQRALEPPAALLRRFPARATVTTAVGLACLCAALVVGALLVPSARLPYRGWWAVAIALTGQTVVHEAAHAVVSQALGAPIREAGIKLWCLVLPVAYVDRTDAYRIRGRVGRVAIALAGPTVDLCAAGISATVVLISGGAALPHTVLVVQLFVLLTNLNPLLPTDGHQAVEAALGEINIRRRALSYIAHRALHAPLPSTLAKLSPRRRSTYVAYGLVSLGYVAVILSGLAASLAHLIGSRT
jgi:putative peptide zinc metalloprotease protein